MNNKAFTVIELLVVTAIIVLLTSLLFANYRVGDRQLALQRAANKLAQDLRRSQELAVSAKEFAGDIPGGYGVYFDLDDIKHYILFADLDSDQAYSGVDEKVEEITLEGTAKIIDLQPVSAASSLTVVFIPPDPVTVFDPVGFFATITLGAGGTEFQASQYTYNYTWDIWGWPEPRADCDTSDETGDCPTSFSASPSDPWYSYDWFVFFGIYQQSRKYQKEVVEAPDVFKQSIQVNQSGLIAVNQGLGGDQCDATADCNDGNLCTNDWCERPADGDSVCHNDILADGFDCGDCRECQSGTCTFLCQGIESSCECVSDVCADCSLRYGEDCSHESCFPIEKPVWQCSGGSCLYSCATDPGCNICSGVPNNTQVPGCDGICQACQSGVCGVANAGTDPGDDCTQGSTAADGCRSNSCAGGIASCGFQTSGDGGCPTCKTCVGATSMACVNKGLISCGTNKVCEAGSCVDCYWQWQPGTCFGGMCSSPWGSNYCTGGRGGAYSMMCGVPCSSKPGTTPGYTGYYSGGATYSYYKCICY